MDAPSIESFVPCVEGTCVQGLIPSFCPAQDSVTAEPADATHERTVKMHIEATNPRRHCPPFCISGS